MKILERLAFAGLLLVFGCGLVWAGRERLAERAFQKSRAYNDQPARHTEMLRRTVELNPWHGRAHAAIGRVHVAQNEWEDAYRATDYGMQFAFSIDMALQRASAAFRVWEQMQTEAAEALMRGQRYDAAALADAKKRAQQALAQVLSIYPNEPEATNLLARTLMRSPKAEERQLAERLLRQLIRERNPTTAEYYGLGQALDSQGRRREAMHMYHRMLRAVPSPYLPDNVFEEYDWLEHLTNWRLYIRDVEKGRITPSGAPTIDTRRPTGRATD